MSPRPRALELSKYDQENLRLKIDEWKSDNPPSSFFFRQLRTTSQTEQTCSEQKHC